MRSITLTAFLGLALAAGCGPGTGPAAHSANSAQSAPAFDEGEAEILRELAAIDRRLEARAHVTPTEEERRRVTIAAVLREDPTVAVVDGSIDPFSFDARMRGLEAARTKAASLALPAVGQRADERELLGKLIDSERSRLEEERALPRSASALVRAVVDTWRTPNSIEQALEADRWLTRRLVTLRETMTAPTESARELDVVRARELDDALDALERLASTPGFTTATQELVRVREAVESVASKPAAKAQSDWAFVARRSQVHLGLDTAPEEMARRFSTLEAELRTRAEQVLAKERLTLAALGPDLESHVFPVGHCTDAVPGSRIRSMAASQEREPSCHLRHFVARTDGNREEALALIAMHDHVVIAEWALEVARGTATIAEAEGRHRLFGPVPPGARARYERIALARPVAAIGGGEAVAILLSGDAKARAISWAGLGDVPLDIARRELASGPAPR